MENHEMLATAIDAVGAETTIREQPSANGGGAAAGTTPIVGLIDGSLEATTNRFHVVLTDDAVAELDELLVTAQELPDGGGSLAHYGIVVEGRGVIEGAELSSDTERITGSRTMPGQTVRTVEVQVLRTVAGAVAPPAARRAGLRRRRRRPGRGAVPGPNGAPAEGRSGSVPPAGFRRFHVPQR
jgi:hypothetical protein